MGKGEAKDSDAASALRERAKDRATLLEWRLGHEFTLTGHRMGWLVTSQAFLFAAWTTSVNSDHIDRGEVRILWYLMPVVGIAIAIAGGISVSAAVHVIDLLVLERARYDGLLDLAPLGPTRKGSWTRVAGHVPTGVLPSLFVMAWVVLLLQRLRPHCSPEDLLVRALGFWLTYVIVWLVFALQRHHQSRRDAVLSALESDAQLTRAKETGAGSLP